LKLGTENRKQVIALAVLGVIAVVAVGYWQWPSESQASPSTPRAAAATSGKVNTRRTSSGRIVTVPEPRLDPTLDFDLLRQSEQIKYAGNGRNIFVAGSIPVLVKPLKNGTAEQNQMRPLPAIQQPPPINLKFFGFASKPGEPKRIFLSQGEDVFIAGEGEIVNRRYRILHISPAAVDVEDVLNNNKQSIPLTQG
jgi:hypothetical protein